MEQPKIDNSNSAVTTSLWQTKSRGSAAIATGEMSSDKQRSTSLQPGRQASLQESINKALYGNAIFSGNSTENFTKKIRNYDMLVYESI